MHQLKKKYVFVVLLLLIIGIGITVFLAQEQQDPRGRAQTASPVISGSLIQWQPMAITFSGPQLSETSTNPNPFLDYRLQVEFTGPSGQKYNVPGFFDGNNASVLSHTTDVYQEQNGLVVFEVESEPANGWTVGTALSGFTGSSYYTWNGADLFTTPGTGVLTYRIKITNPGKYNFRIHNRHDHPDTTEENDVWAKLDSDVWVKINSAVRGQWTFNTNQSFSDGTQRVAYYDLSAGEHTLQLSARSKGFHIDRVHFFKDGVAGENKSLPVSPVISSEATPTPAQQGSTWKVRFTPDQAGTWTYKASFRQGSNVAVDLSPTAGTPTSFDGQSGTFSIQPKDPNAPGHLKYGTLKYVGTNGGDSLGFHLKFRDGPYWLKGGVDSPENLLGYTGFDNTPNAMHSFSPHVQDWQTGNPIFNTNSPDSGKGLIGAINYLASKNANSVYFLPMNIGGDGKDTSPYVSVANWAGSTANDNLHFDISKLTQWEQAFRYLQEKGIHLHFVLMEAETANKVELDNATLGNERKLFYREMIARFGHHNSLQWNVSEEYDAVLPGSDIHTLAIDPNVIKQFAQYIRDVDPYDHPITVHQAFDPDQSWTPFLGDNRFDLTSFQYGGSVIGYGAEVEEWRNKTKNAGRPITISMDEIRATIPTNADAQRKELLWHTFLSGGQIEWYVGGEDQSLEDFRKYDAMWTYTWYARKFVEQNLPFWQMEPQDTLVTGENTTFNGAQVFVKPGQVYAIYLPNANPSGSLNLTGASGTFTKQWYNPRTGNFEGGSTTVSGGGSIALGTPPSSPSEDWVVLIKNIIIPTNTPTPTAGSATPTPTLTLGGPTPTSPPADSTVTLTPTADTYVYSTFPTTNYATDTTMRVDGNPIQYGYMRFDLGSLSGKQVQSAKIRLYIISGSIHSQIFKTIDDTWTETGVTYNARPAHGATFATNTGGTIGTYREIDVTNAVNSEKGQLFSFAIENSGDDDFNFASRESANDPQLVVTFASTATNTPVPPTATPTRTPTPLPPTNTPTPVQIVGDINKDGRVDLLDFNIWRDEFLDTVQTTQSDLNADGKVDLLDFNMWLQGYKS
ncbi:MAG: DNRLRE domain-containing protein [Candidatus Levybacteria bacterium]|nr:DNRLRE domain-containing protein [Candidatus Levybacteria bacterium]